MPTPPPVLEGPLAALPARPFSLGAKAGDTGIGVSDPAQRPRAQSQELGLIPGCQGASAAPLRDP